MATGDTLFILNPMGGTPPATVYATLDTIATTTDVPLITIPVLDFAGATANEHMDWHLVMPSHYLGGGLSFYFQYASDGTVAGTVIWEARCIALADEVDLSSDLNIDGATAASVTDTLPADPETDKLNYTAVAALTHALAGSPSVGQQVIIRVTRDQGTDTSTDDAQLLSVYVKET